MGVPGPQGAKGTASEKGMKGYLPPWPHGTAGECRSNGSARSCRGERKCWLTRCKGDHGNPGLPGQPGANGTLA